MSQANSLPTLNAAYTASTYAPTDAEMASMIDALDAVDPRPPLTSYEQWIADGIEAAAETRAFERRRAALMSAIFGDDVGEAA